MRAALFALVLTAGCSMYHDIEQDDGFRGVRLGSSPDQVPDVALHDDDGFGGTVYRPTGDVEPWGRATLSPSYWFWDDQLWKIEIRTGSSKNLLPEVTGRYGTPSFATPWQWDGETVRMNFKGTEYDSTAVLTIVKKPLEAERERELAARREADRKARAARKAEVEAAKAAAEAMEADTDTDVGPGL